jgi:Kef-type K+ transport system membrane component KefB
MTWIIAVLLGLILVAMVSSNKDAANGVWKVIRFALVSIALLIVWGALISFSLWYSANYFKGEWEKILYISMFVFLPPVYLWISRKRLAENFKRDKKAAYRKCAIFISVGAAFLLVGVIIGEVRATYENGGWFMVLTPLALTSIVLLWRTLRTPRKWREVWCGLPPLPDLYEVLDKERYEESLIDEAEWKKIEATWDEQTSERQYELMYEREERWRNFGRSC